MFDLLAILLLGAVPKGARIGTVTVDRNLFARVRAGDWREA